MTQLKILSTKSFSDYKEVTVELRLDIPGVLNTLTNKKEIAESYKEQYGIERVDNGYIYFVKVFTIPDELSVEGVQAVFNASIQAYETALNAFTLLPTDDMIGKTYDGQNWTYIIP